MTAFTGHLQGKDTTVLTSRRISTKCDEDSSSCCESKSERLPLLLLARTFCAFADCMEGKTSECRLFLNEIKI